MAKMCIISGQEAPDGYPVEDTRVIQCIRSIKKKFNMVSNNTLVVSKASYDEYKKKRKSFEQKLMLHLAGGAILFILSIALPLLSGKFEPVSAFMVFLLAVFLVALAMLSYVPPIMHGHEPKESSGASGTADSASLSNTISTEPEKTARPSTGTHSDLKHSHSSKKGKARPKANAGSKRG